MSFVVSWVRASRLGAAALVCGLAGLADMSAASAAHAADKDLLTLGVGAYDVIDEKDSTTVAQAEYVSSHKLWVLNPFAGLMGTFDGTFYGYGGVAYDLQLAEHWVLTPSIAAGLWARGEGKDLGSTVEFRPAVQIAYQFDDHSRAGVLFYHMSNAGLSNENPGTEVLMATYGIALDN